MRPCPPLTAPNVGSDTHIRFTLNVTDGTAHAADHVVITITDSPNSPPAAGAGADLVVYEGQTVTLVGTVSGVDGGDGMRTPGIADPAGPGAASPAGGAYRAGLGGPARRREPHMRERQRRRSRRANGKKSRLSRLARIRPVGCAGAHQDGRRRRGA